MKIGLLHPGAMGVTVGATIKNSGHDVFWVSDRRGAASRARAESAGLRDAEFLTALCQQVDVIVSVCPPAAAEEVAQSVISRKFGGLYVEANAIAPERTHRIGAMVEAAGGRLVDGGIIGSPAIKPGTTRLYLSGAHAGEAAALFAAGPMEAVVVGDAIGKASALKMCYAGFGKGAAALLATIVAAAEALGVRDELFAEWAKSSPGALERANGEVPRITAKAWRWIGEMEEIAATMRSAGVPGEFHDGAREVFARLAPFKDATAVPELSAVIAALRGRRS